jgi:hypothetical protein
VQDASYRHNDHFLKNGTPWAVLRRGSRAPVVQLLPFGRFVNAEIGMVGTQLLSVVGAA